MKKAIVLFIHVLLFTHTQAQEPDVCPFTITGTVIDEHDRQPLGNAVLEIKETGAKVWSDSLGKFTFPSICHGTYTITCIHPGCDTLSKTINVTGNTVVNFEPEHHPEMLKQVNIMALQTIVLIDPGLEAGALRGKDLQRSKSGSLAQMISTIPGVVMQSTGSTIAKPVIHGMEGNRLLLINNGVPLEGQQWGSEHAPEIDPLTAGNIKVIRGASTIRYGMGAIGGVVEINPKYINQSALLSGEYFTSVATNGRQLLTSAMLEGRLKKHTEWFARAQGSYGRGGNTRAPGYYINNTGINNYSYSLAGGYAGDKTNVQVWHNRVKSELGIYTGAHVANLTDLMNAFQQSQSFSDTTSFTYSIGNPRQHILHDISKITLSRKLNHRNTLFATYARQFNHRQEFDAHGHEEDGEEEHASLDMMATTHYGNVKWIRNDKHSLEAGLNGSMKKNTWEGRFLIPNYRSLQAGGYVLAEGPVGTSKLRYTAGARYDIYKMEAWLWEDTILSNPQFDFNGLSAQASLRYNFSYGFNLSLNTGLSWRPPAVNELFSNGLHHGAAAYETGNLNLKKENVWHTDVTVTRSNTRITGMASVYADRFTDFIYLQPDLQPVLTVQGAFPSFSFLQANAWVAGADAMLDFSVNSKLVLQANASVLRGYNLTTDDFLPFMPANRFGYGFRYESSPRAKIHNAFFSLGAQHVLKQNHIQKNGDYVPAPDGYMLLNCQTGFQVRVKNQWIDISLQGNNLLNKKYRDYLNRFRYYTDETGINFTLRVNIPFVLIKKTEEKEKAYEIE